MLIYEYAKNRSPATESDKNILKEKSDRGKWYVSDIDEVLSSKEQPTITEQIDETSQIYSQLGNKTQSENVILPKDLEDNTVYEGKNFWDKIVPEAKSMFDRKFPGQKPMIIAFRGNGKKSFLQNYKEQFIVGNPFDWQKGQSPLPLGFHLLIIKHSVIYLAASSCSSTLLSSTWLTPASSLNTKISSSSAFIKYFSRATFSIAFGLRLICQSNLESRTY